MITFTSWAKEDKAKKRDQDAPDDDYVAHCYMLHFSVLGMLKQWSIWAPDDDYVDFEDTKRDDDLPESKKAW